VFKGIQFNRKNTIYFCMQNHLLAWIYCIINFSDDEPAVQGFSDDEPLVIT